MRLQTRTWDQFGPRFVLDSTHAANGTYENLLMFCPDLINPVFPVYQTVFLDQQSYVKNKYYLDENGTKATEEFDPSITYYKKPKIEWTVKINEEGMKSGSLIKGEGWENNRKSGFFTMEEITQAIPLPSFTFSSDSQQHDSIELTLEIKWDEYTYAYNTRNEEVHSGTLMARLDSEDDSFFWAPELYYNSDFISMTDELQVYWDVFYHNNTEGYKIILSEKIINEISTVNADGEIELENIETINKLTEADIPDQTAHQSTFLLSTYGALTPGAELWVEMWAYGKNLESAHIEGMVGRINQAPNPPIVKMTATEGGANIIDDYNDINFELSPKNEVSIIEGESERVIIENGEYTEDYKDMTCIVWASRPDEVGGGYYTVARQPFYDISVANYGNNYKYIATDRAIEDISNFTTLEVTCTNCINTYFGGTGQVRVGLTNIPDTYDYQKSVGPRINFNVSSLGTKTIDISNLATDYPEVDKWYLGATSSYWSGGYTLSSVKLTGGTATKKLLYIENDPDNTPEDFTSLAHSIYGSIGNGPKSKLGGIFSNDVLQFNLTKELLKKFGVTEPGDYVFNFYTYDGLDFSEPTAYNFSYYPEFEFTYTGEVYDNKDDGIEDTVVTSQLTFYFNLKNNITQLGANPFIQLEDGTIYYLPFECGTYSFSGASNKSIAIKLSSSILENLGVNKDAKFKICSEVFYASAPSIKQTIEASVYCMIPQTREAAEVFSDENLQIIITDATENSWQNYFKDTIQVKLKAPELKAGYPLINTATVQACDLQGKALITTPMTKVADYWEADINTKQLSANQQITLKFTVKDTNSTTLSYETDELIKITPIKFASSKISFSRTRVRVRYNEDLIISYPRAEAIGTNAEDIKYIYQFNLSGYGNYILEPEVTQELDTLKISLNDEMIQSLFLGSEELKDLNKDVQSNFIITASDSFDQITSLTGSLYFMYEADPEFEQNSQITIFHNYQTQSIPGPGQEDDLTDFVQVPQPYLGDYALDIRMFNPGEKVILKFPKAHDRNGDEDIIEYELLIESNTMPLDIADVPEIGSYWENHTIIRIPTEDLIDYGDGYYYYQYVASNYQSNECIYFTITAVDSTGRASNGILSDTFIIGCRATAPKFDQGNLNISVKDQDGNWLLNLRWEEFKILDLGGSSVQKWSESYYNNFKNFERNIKGHVNKIYLQVDISPNADFTSPLSSKLGESWDGEFLRFIPWDTDNQANIPIPLESLETAALTDPERFYLRFTLVIQHGPDSYVYSSSQIISYFGNIPTVSHRAHRVGLNSSEFKTEDVLVIRNYQNYKTIRLLGEDEFGTSQEIIIDLGTGAINGLTINGGSW